MVAAAILAVILALMPVQTIAQADDCFCDVILVLDASGSIQQEDWPKVQSFASVIVNDLAQGGKLGANGTRVGLVTFSNTAQLDLPLTGDATTLQNAIQALQKTSGTTNTAAAIQVATNELVSKKREPDACQTIKVVTDGMSNVPEDTLNAAAAAKAANISVVAIGVGPYSNSTELNLVASEPKTKNALELSDFTGLDQLAHALFDKCASPQPPALNITQRCECDVMIVLDSSGSIPPSEWEKVRDFARVFANAYKSRLLTKNVRMGLVTYSTQPVLNVALTYDYSQILAGINNAPRLGGTTNTADALSMASNELIQNQRQQLQCQTIKIVTDGRSNDPAATARVAYAIKNGKQQEIVAVGVGTGISRQELTAMASEPLADNMLVLADFTNLTLVAHSLADKCDATIDNSTDTPDTTDICHCDLYMLLDSSGQISTTEWASMKKFAQNMIGNLYNYLSPTDVRITVIQYATTANVVVKQSANYNELMGAVSNMKLASGATNTYVALDLVRNMIDTDNANINKCKIVKVVTDGASSNAQRTAASAHLLKKLDSAEIMAIAVGQGQSNPELQVMASPPVQSNIINVASWQALEALPAQLAGQCNHTITPSPLLPAKTPTPIPVDDCNCDMMIVLDNSGSIPKTEWIKMMDFVRVIVTDLKGVMGPNKARIGLVKYSTGSTLISGLTWDANALLRAITGMGTATGGSTRTDLGISTAESELIRSPRAQGKKCKTMKIVTDGASTSPAATQAAAHRAKVYGIYLVAIGVGRGVNPTELRAVATDPDSKNVIMLSDFSGLDQLAHAIGDKCNIDGTGTPTPMPFANDPCHCDYALVMDTSLSIGAQYPGIINFATTIVASLRDYLDGDNDTRVSVIAFAATATVVVPLTGNFQGLMQGIARMPRLTLGTNIYAGIQAGTNQLVTNSRGLGTCKRMIVVTDGQSSGAGGPARTVAAAHIAKTQYGITIIGIGIGKSLSMTEINNMASAPLATNAVNINTFADLPRVAQSITGQCSKNASLTTYQQDCQCDIMLVLDGSGSVPANAWQQIEDFCTDMVQGWATGMQNGTTRIGIVTYGTTASLVSPLTGDVAALMNTCANLVKPNGGTATDAALKIAGNELRANGGLCRAIKLLTDGNSNNPKATDLVAESLKLQDRVHIQAVGIGNGINMNELRDVCSAPQVVNAIQIKDFSGLSQVAHGITDKCGSAVYTQQSQCQYVNMMRCTNVNSRDRCALPAAYASCSQAYKCPDVLKYLCGLQFVGSPLYRTCAAVPAMCAAAAKASQCNTPLFSQCVTDANKYATAFCARLNRYIACAVSSACQDMIQAYCTGTGQQCAKLSSCTYLQPGNAPRVGGIVIRPNPEQEAIDASLSMFLPEGQKWGESGASQVSHGAAIVGGLAVLVAVLAAALVGLVVKYRRAQMAGQVDVEEELLA